ncbi:MAG: family 78 glycoside hydrolase catalytic domain [Armatimonadota bacterium]|nr:family 78 glycoside hydrolase catalytic domain [bacterium]
MLEPFMSIVGGESGSRRSRRGRSRNQMPVRTDFGSWIWIQGDQAARNYYLYSRKVFDLTSQPTEAVLMAAADSRYKVFVNGHYVGKGVSRSAGNCTYYDSYNITELLKKGKNVIAFLAHHFGEDTSFCLARRPGLICRAEITTGDEKQVIVTDDTWKVHRADDWTDQGARINESLGFQEVYDSAGRMDGWNEVKFKEKGWEDAVIVGVPPESPWGDLIERGIPALREEKVLPASIVGLYNSPDRGKDVAIDTIADIMASSELSNLTAGNVKNPESLLADNGTTHVKTPRGDRGVAIILDFGREVFGNVEIGIGGSGTGTIDLGYSEVLEDGRVKPNRLGLKHADRVILKKGRLDWQSFEPRAFRYLQIEFRRCSKSVALEHVRVNQTTYPVEMNGDFQCSDDLVNDIWKTGAYTAKLCMEDTFIDCPGRDRAQWWADVRVESRAAYYAFNDTTLLARGLRQIAGTQDRNGAVMGIYPGGGDKLVPDFALYWVFSILDYYAFSDDSGLVRELYPNVRRLMTWFARFEREYGLIADVPGWPYIDSGQIERQGTLTSLNCLHYHALRVSSALASILGRTSDAEEYEESARKLRLAVNKYLYSPEHGLYADSLVDGKIGDKFSGQSNILAALFDIPDHYQKASIIRWILNDSAAAVATPFFMSHVLEVLYSMDRHKEALDIICSKWGAIVKSGDGTFHEFFDREGSGCHGWASGPTRDLLAEYVGIKPVPGSHRFSVTPHEGGLKWARGTVATRTGPLTIEWRSTPRVFTIDAQVPDGLKVDVYPPLLMNAKVSVDGKSNPSGLVTLGGGSHQIKVTASRPAKPKLVDDSSKLSPIPIVELLEELSPRARRSLGLTISRRGERTKSGRSRAKGAREAVEVADTEMPVEMLPAPEMDATVGENEIIPETTPSTEEGELAAQAAPKSRRRRSRRGRGRSRTSPEESAIAQVPAEPEGQEVMVPEGEITPEAAPATEGEPADQAAPKSRRRRSRRGRGRSKAAPEEPAIAQAPAENEEQEPLVSEGEVISETTYSTEEGEPADQSAPKSRRRRSRRGRGRSKAAPEESVTEHVSTEPEVQAANIDAVEAESHVETKPASPEESSEGDEASKKSSRRRSHRGGRRRSTIKPEPDSNAQPEAVVEAYVETPAPVEPREEPVAQPVSETPSEEPPKKKRRTYTRRPRKSADKEQEPPV